MRENVLEDVELTRVSSKGQIVIPHTMRQKIKIKEGNVFAVMSPNDDTIVLKRINKPLLEDDLILLREVEEAWREVEKGRFRRMLKKNFLKELEKW